MDWDELKQLEERSYSSRRAAKNGSAYWNHEACKDERALRHAEMGDDIDD